MEFWTQLMTTTEKLLDAAEVRMRKGGYNAVSFRDLAIDTEIKSSSVHYHFPRKEDLGVALVKRYRERYFEALAKESSKAESPKEKLLAFRAVYRKALNKDDAICLCGLLGAESAGLPDALNEELRAFFNGSIAWVADALPEALSESLRRKQASSLVATHQGAMMLATNLNDKKVFDTITALAIDQALAGFES
jgi:TetR/AcrR family transcriptional repressor of nem operon